MPDADVNRESTQVAEAVKCMDEKMVDYYYTFEKAENPWDEDMPTVCGALQSALQCANPGGSPDASRAGPV